LSEQGLRANILACLGRFPKRVLADLQVGETEDQGDHTRTLVTYLVEKHERIPAWLLIPKEIKPEQGWPAILAIHQHAGQFELGKSEPAGLSGNPQYYYGLEMCLRGYVVLCPDQLCFEARRPAENLREQNKVYEGSRYEEFEFAARIAQGSCLQTKYLHDLACGIDVLSSLPQVNAERIGVIGHSLGGQQTLWLTWYDKRVKAAVSSCGFGLVRDYIDNGILHNRAAYVPGLLQYTDLDGLVKEISPRPFMLTAGKTDPLFPLDGLINIIEAARKVYAQLGAIDHFQSVIFEGGHNLPDEVKVEAYTFLDRWLKA
jgi:dienelactone hydrolase